MWKTVILVAAVAACIAVEVGPTICDDHLCTCDAFSRITCVCIHDYDEVTIRPKGSYSILPGATAINITGCARVFILSDSINSLRQLRTVSLNNNSKIYLNERSLHWAPFPNIHEVSAPGLRITIEFSNIEDINSHTFQGRIDDIILKGNTIQRVRSFAFSSLTNTKRIELIENNIQNIDLQAFKKFTTEYFTIRQGNISLLPSRTLSDVEVVSDFIIDSVNIDTISSMAFLVNGPKNIRIENNNFRVIEGEAFQMTNKGPVIFRNNTIRELKPGVFKGLHIQREISAILGLQELFIDNNTVDILSAQSVSISESGYQIRIEMLHINQTCDCQNIKHWLDLVNENGGSISCLKETYPENYYISVQSFNDTKCGTFKENFWIFIIVALAVAIIAIIIIIILVSRREKILKRKFNVVMPEGKTYRETELHVVIERAELLTTDL